MLVLTRKIGERVIIGDDVVITVLEARNDKVRLGIDAPADVPVYREEIAPGKEDPSKEDPSKEE